jgi:chaperonin GroES
MIMTEVYTEKTMLKPLGYTVLAKRVEAPKTHFGILLPEQQKKSTHANVIALGTPKLLNNGKTIEFPVKEGDLVLVEKYAGNEVTLHDEEFLILRVEDIMGIIEKK